MDDADDVVGVLADHREAGVAGAAGPASITSSAGVVVLHGLVIRTRGVMTSAAAWSENRSVRPSSVACPRRAGPRCAERRTSELSSSARAGAGQLLLRLDAEGPEDRVGGAVEQQDQRLEDRGEQPPGTASPPWRSRSGSASAKFFGTSSPSTIESSVAMATPTTVPTDGHTRRRAARAPSADRRSSELIAGSIV